MTNVKPFREFNFLPNLSIPNLDDRTFEDLVQECILRIPRYCPEWTNHNPGDPGITLIELFAWLTDHMLYRFNLVPRRYYIAFLELLGITLQPPTPAHTALTFSLTRAQASPLRIAAGTEVATIRTETEPAIVFTTDRDLIIGQPQIQRLFTSIESSKERPSHLTPVGEAGQLAEVLELFPTCQPKNCFYLLLNPSEPDRSDGEEGMPNQIFGNILAFTFRGEIAATTNLDPNHPPLDWQAWDGERWISKILHQDDTRGFSFSRSATVNGTAQFSSADVVLHLPQTWAVDEFDGHRGHWIRCVYTNVNNEVRQSSYDRSPRITEVNVRALGGAIDASEVVRMGEELLGVSNGKPGQEFQLQESPVLKRDRDRQEFIQIRWPDGAIEEWVEVADFGDSDANDPHYTLDSCTGAVQFGALVREPNALQQQTRERSYLEPWGKHVLRPTAYDPRRLAPSVLAADLETMQLPEWQYGRIPPIGAEIWMGSYRVGGGSRGNVDAHKLTVLKTAIPYVKQVSNPQKAQGGQDSESLDAAVMRVPHMLRHPDVAVTPENFEAIAGRFPNIYRAHCPPICETPGAVKLLLVPDPRPQPEFGAAEFAQTFPQGIHPEHLRLTRRLKAELTAELDRRKPLGIQVLLAEPHYTGVKVMAKVRLAANYAQASRRDEMCHRLCAKLYYFLNPITGGFDGTGWELDRSVTNSDVMAVLQALPEVEYVADVSLFSLHRDSDHSWYRLSRERELMITPRRFGLLTSWSDASGSDQGASLDSAHVVEILNP
jgi:predicted phage baseplate assembly protein